MSKDKIFTNGKKRRGINRYVDEDFAKLLDEIKQARITIGKDTFHTIKADWRLTLAMLRHPLNNKIKEDIINANLD